MSTEFTTGPLVLEEMMKIVSLMENPKEAEHVRRSLRFYDVPEGLQFNWGRNGELMEMLRHFDNPQNAFELEQMLKIVWQCDKVLEIGSNFGGTLKRMASGMKRGSTLVSVDLPCDDTPKFLNPLETLKENCRKIGLMGGNVQLFIGDSHAPLVIDAVNKLGPFDFVFIDGDHTYEGMKADWENYGPMGKIVGFHDIGGGIEGCKKCWEEIKADSEAKGLKVEEFHGPEERRFGIGIVYRE